MENIFLEWKRHRPTVYTKKETVPGAFSNKCRGKANTHPDSIFLWVLFPCDLPHRLSRGLLLPFQFHLTRPHTITTGSCSLNSVSVSFISLFKATWANIWPPSSAFKMNAITSNLYILKFINERNAELKTESNWNRIPCLLL